jgi:hypothetical protein
MLIELLLAAAPMGPTPADPTAERPPVSYADREAHWAVDCRAELGRLAAGTGADLGAIQRCAFIHRAMDRPACADLLEILSDSELPADRRRVAAGTVLDARTGEPLDEGQCAQVLGTLE